jgi:CRP/FNR family transcriptional regulator
MRAESGTPQGNRLNFAPDQQGCQQPSNLPHTQGGPWQRGLDFAEPPDPRTYCQSRSDGAQLVNLMVGRRKVRQGASLYREHDRFNFIYVVQSGSFKSTLALAGGCEQVCSFQMTGELLGLDGVAEDRHASSATALEDSEVSMGVHHIVIRLISREIVRRNIHMALLGNLSSSQRLAAFLLNQSECLHARGYSALEFHLKMTRGEIGSFLGMSLETVSRTFTELRQQRLLTVDRRHIRISDLAGLTRL